MDIRERLAAIRCFLLDMDGTFYLGNQLIEGSLDFLQALHDTGRQCLFLTNNSSKSASFYQEKLARMEEEKAAGKKRGKKDKDAVLPPAPAQETPAEEAVETAAPAPQPEAPAAEEAEEAFVEESFLEEPENTKE